MASIKTQFTVGLFMIVGLAIVAIAVIWLGMSHVLQKGAYYVAYFDESVQGLDRDSALKYRGVTIGRVQSLGVAPDGRLIQAVLKIESDIKPSQDWVAQLKSVGITGLMFVELDHRMPGEPDLSPKIDFPSKYPVIPTKPSGIKQFFEGINSIMEQFKALDVPGLSHRMRQAIDNVNKTLEDAQVAALSKDLRAALQGFERLVTNPRWERLMATAEEAGKSVTDLSRKANRTVETIDTAAASMDQDFHEAKISFQEALSEFRASLKKADRFFVSGNTLFSDSRVQFSSVEREMALTLRELRIATENLDRILQDISNNPALLLFSQPPPPRPEQP